MPYDGTMATSFHTTAESAQASDPARPPSDGTADGILGAPVTSQGKTRHEFSVPPSAKEGTPDGALGQDRLWTPLFGFIVATALCCFMVGQGLNSGTSVYLVKAGDTATFAGMLAATFSAAAAIARLISGPIIDQSGRFRVMLCGMGLLAVGTAIPAISGDPATFVACRVAQGIGFSAATTAAATAAADVLPLSRLGEGVGYYGLGQAVAMSIGPALALFLVETDPSENLYRGLFAIGMAGVALSACCRYEHDPSRLPPTSTYRLRLEREHPDAREGRGHGRDSVHPSELKTDSQGSDWTKETQPGKKRTAGIAAHFFERSALPGTLPILVLSPAFGFGIFFVGLYGTSLGIENAGLFYTLSAASMIAVRLKSRSFMDRIAPLKLFAASVICGLTAFTLLLAAPHSIPLYYLSGLSYGICMGISLPLNQSVALKNTRPERWGAANALYLLASDIGIGLSSALWGIVNDQAGFSATIGCVMACIALSYVMAWLWYPRENAGKPR